METKKPNFKNVKEIYNFVEAESLKRAGISAPSPSSDSDSPEMTKNEAKGDVDG